MAKSSRRKGSKRNTKHGNKKNRITKRYRRQRGGYEGIENIQPPYPRNETDDQQPYSMAPQTADQQSYSMAPQTADQQSYSMAPQTADQQPYSMNDTVDQYPNPMNETADQQPYPMNDEGGQPYSMTQPTEPTDNEVPNSGHSTVDKIGDFGHNAVDKAHEVGSKVSEFGHDATSKIGDMGHKVGSVFSNMGNKFKDAFSWFTDKLKGPDISDNSEVISNNSEVINPMHEGGGRRTRRRRFTRHLKFNRRYASKKLRKVLNILKFKKSRKNIRKLLQFGGGGRVGGIVHPSNASSWTPSYGPYPNAVGRIDIPLR